MIHYLIGFTVKKNNLLSTLDHWGPSFNVSFELKADKKSFKGNGLKSVLQFTSTGKGCCNPGDRILAVYLEKSKKIQIALGYLILKLIISFFTELIATFARVRR